MGNVEASVGISREWDAYEAGRIVAEETLGGLDDEPSFFLLFSTIHYSDHGGFEKFLEGVWEILPDDTPLVGGTVAGFMSSEGSYTRGAAGMAVNIEDSEIKTGVGHNSKRNPEKAAKEMVDSVKTEESYSNKLLFSFPSGSQTPYIPGVGRKKVYETRAPNFLVSSLMKVSRKLFQKGVGREEKILEALSEKLPDYQIIGGSAVDDNKMKENYQFVNQGVKKNAVVGLSVLTDEDIDISSNVSVESTENTLDAETFSEKYILKNIDGKTASEGFLEAIGWPKSNLDKALHRRTFFYPLLFEKEQETYPEVIGSVIGENLVCGYDIESPEITLGRTSSEILIESIETELSDLADETEFAFIVYCSALLEMVGKDIFRVQERISDLMGEKPFLLIATGGEDVKMGKGDYKHSNETINLASFK